MTNTTSSMNSSIAAVARLRPVFATLILTAFAGSAGAQSIPVPNGSFESPTVPLGPPGVSNQIDDWQKTPQPVWYNPADFQGITWDQTSGIFPNPPSGVDGHIDNVTDSQAAYMFSLPGAGFFQELGATYQAGNAYQLSVDLFGGGGLADGSQFMISLYHLDGASSVNVAMLPVNYTAAAFSQPDHFYTFTATSPILQGGDAAVGQNIGIALTSLSGPGQGYWDIDNVRLTVVPEPSTLALLGMGLGGGLLFWRRRNSRNA